MCVTSLSCFLSIAKRVYYLSFFAFPERSLSFEGTDFFSHASSKELRQSVCPLNTFGFTNIAFPLFFFFFSLINSIVSGPPKHSFLYYRRIDEKFPLTLVVRSPLLLPMYIRRKNNWTASIREVFARRAEIECAQVSREIYRNRM